MSQRTIFLKSLKSKESFIWVHNSFLANEMSLSMLRLLIEGSGKKRNSVYNLLFFFLKYKNGNTNYLTIPTFRLN